MRTHKFRGVSLDNSQWVFGQLLDKLIYIFGEKVSYIYTPDEIDVWDSEFGLLFTQVKPETVGQFTGLFDKNGKEIYEGDIVKVNKLTYDKHNEFLPLIGKVEFYKGAYHLDINNMLYLSYGKDVEIIGNIYENPELLEAKDA